MKEPGETCGKAGSKSPDTRYYTTLRPEEPDVVERLADLIVDFAKRDGRTGRRETPIKSTPHRR